jgi:large conductance mechanosensitive channel
LGTSSLSKGHAEKPSFDKHGLVAQIQVTEPTMKGFRQFLLRGNVVDLAVGVVVGSAFGNVVSAMVKDLLTPFLAAVVRKPDFSAISFTMRGSRFLVGDFINNIISFIIIAAATYYMIVLPMNTLTERMQRDDKPAQPSTKKCPECLSEIPIGARRCAHCTQPVPVSVPQPG